MRVSLSTRVVLPASTDWEAFRRSLPERARLYAQVPGLRSKTFFLDVATREYGAHYVFESREALDTFMASPLFQAALQKFGRFETQIREVVALLEGGTISS